MLEEQEPGGAPARDDGHAEERHDWIERAAKELGVTYEELRSAVEY